MANTQQKKGALLKRLITSPLNPGLIQPRPRRPQIPIPETQPNGQPWATQEERNAYNQGLQSVMSNWQLTNPEPKWGINTSADSPEYQAYQRALRAVLEEYKKTHPEPITQPVNTFVNDAWGGFWTHGDPTYPIGQQKNGQLNPPPRPPENDRLQPNPKQPLPPGFTIKPTPLIGEKNGIPYNYSQGGFSNPSRQPVSASPTTSPIATIKPIQPDRGQFPKPLNPNPLQPIKRKIIKKTMASGVSLPSGRSSGKGAFSSPIKLGSIGDLAGGLGASKTPDYKDTL